MGIRGRILKAPIRTIAPPLFRRCRLQWRVERRTFFGRAMQLVLPDMVSASIWRHGFFEEDVCFYLLSVLTRGDTFIDIGGHFGFFSMLARELVGETGTVVAFEPMPRTRRVFAENMKMAAPANCSIVPAAAGAAHGRLRFKDFGLAGSAFATSAEARSGTVRLIGEVDVEVRPVDSVIDELGLKSCQLIKIDAENAEYDVVQGALRCIRHFRPALILEAGDSGEAASSTRRVVDLVLQEGYLPFEFHDWSLRPHRVRASYGYQNLLLVPAERAAELTGRPAT